mgnify:CR=1 FL=1
MRSQATVAAVSLMSSGGGLAFNWELEFGCWKRTNCVELEGRIGDAGAQEDGCRQPEW